MGATARSGLQASLHDANGEESPRNARSRKASAPSAVACLTCGLSVTPPVSSRSVKMLCDPPWKTASAFLVVPTAS